MTSKQHYQDVAVAQLREQFKYKNIHQIPKVSHISINIGIGEAAQDKKMAQVAADVLKAISGQKPCITLARRSEAGFKIRTGWPVGCKVTLRGQRMYDFMNKLVLIVLPRVRDFRGLNPKSFDGRGNYSFGISEHIVFPEIDYDKVEKMLGMDITIATTALNNDEAKSLLLSMGFPFFKSRGS